MRICIKLRPALNAFTLAEVLITLGIIGVVAAMTIPILMNNIQDQQYKTAYKKAYSTVSQALLKAQNDSALVEFTGTNGGTGMQQNFLAIQQYFSVVKSCDVSHLSDCWDTSSSSESYRAEQTSGVLSFVDKSGMAWRVRTADSGGVTPTLMVDINGIQKPNKYGQDRFPLYFSNTPDNNISIGYGNISGLPTKMVPGPDTLNNSGNTCPSASTHPCYYASWLYGSN